MSCTARLSVQIVRGPAFAPVLGLLLWVILTAGSARAEGAVHRIADTAELAAFLASDAAAGAQVLLAPGRYEPIVLTGSRIPAAIRSADPANPAVIAGVKVENFDGLVMEDLVFSYTYEPHHEIHIRPFHFRWGRDLVVRNVRIVGDVARGRDALSDGLGFGIGLAVGRVAGVRIEGCHISVFHRGLVMGHSSDVHVIGNEIVGMRMDGMNFVQMTRIWIEHNLIHDFDRSDDPRDHSDMIQFWSNGADAPSRDIFIRHNVLNAAEGRATQSIFMRNDQVDRGLAGDEMIYRNVTIEENVIINAHAHGITLGETVGVRIRNNTLVQNPRATSRDPAQPVTIPRINMKQASRDVVIRNNIVARVVGDDTPADWDVADNLLIQNASLMAPNHYSRVFAGLPGGDPGALDSYCYAPTGPAGAGSMGAALLRDGSRICASRD